jgi:hypothetical protein
MLERALIPDGSKKKGPGNIAPGPTSLETRVKPKNCYSSAKCRRLTEPMLTRPAPSSIRERGGLGVLSGRNAEDIKMTERTSMTPLKALASISSFLSPVTSNYIASEQPATNARRRPVSIDKLLNRRLIAITRAPMTIFVTSVEDAFACTLTGALGTVVSPRMQGRYTAAVKILPITP